MAGYKGDFCSQKAPCAICAVEMTPTLWAKRAKSKADKASKARRLSLSHSGLSGSRGHEGDALSERDSFDHGDFMASSPVDARGKRLMGAGKPNDTVT